MSSMIEVEITRSGELEKLSNRVMKEIVGKAVRDTAFETEKECKSTVPVDTGNLKRSIHSEIDSDNFKIWGEYYWKYLNFGTCKMGARPFATNAAKKIPPFFERNVKDQIGGL